MLTDRRLTVLHAMGGFDKTVLLGRCCRALGEQCIAVAFDEARLETFEAGGDRAGGTGAQTPGRQSDI